MKKIDSDDLIEMMWMAITVVIAVVGVSMGIMAISAEVAKKYGIVAGMLSALLPISAATICLILLIVKDNKGENN